MKDLGCEVELAMVVLSLPVEEVIVTGLENEASGVGFGLCKGRCTRDSVDQYLP